MKVTLINRPAPAEPKRQLCIRDVPTGSAFERTDTGRKKLGFMQWDGKYHYLDDPCDAHNKEANGHLAVDRIIPLKELEIAVSLPEPK